jgi:hypothetical protein
MATVFQPLVFQHPNVFQITGADDRMLPVTGGDNIVPCTFSRKRWEYMQELEAILAGRTRKD